MSEFWWTLCLASVIVLTQVTSNETTSIVQLLWLSHIRRARDYCLWLISVNIGASLLWYNLYKYNYLGYSHIRYYFNLDNQSLPTSFPVIQPLQYNYLGYYFTLFTHADWLTDDIALQHNGIRVICGTPKKPTYYL